MSNSRDLTVASFNLLNLQLPNTAMYPNTRRYTPEIYNQKLTWTANIIKQLDADIIGFQELWSAKCLVDVFEKANLSDDYTLVFIKDPDAGADLPNWDGIAVAMAVRKPWQVENWKRHKDFPEELLLNKRDRSLQELQNNPDLVDETEDEDLDSAHEDEEIHVDIKKFSRSPLEVILKNADRDDVPNFHVFCAHFKSKRGSRLDREEYHHPTIDFKSHKDALGAGLSTIRRTAEATALRIILNKIMKDTNTPVIVLGDLNDGQFSNTLAILSNQPDFRWYADSTAAASNNRNDTGLFPAINLQQLRSLKDTYYSHEYKNVPEVIDHVLASEEFYDYSNSRFWSFRDMHILNDHTDDHGKDKIKSDHGVVRVRFDWNKAEDE
ncbi:endonuclease/exonuclease/phosphatase family protein [Curvivirga sp.]|uniref:endonuclease/exonuclease/phosphatase family protein n=1 Tax=Curvivirga sp. TaxID=2856848 RepID=UPI003B5C8656